MLNRRKLVSGAAAVAAYESLPAEAWTHGIINTLPARQAAYVALKLGMFIHFNMGTFTGTELPPPSTPVNTFAPTGLNVAQWVTAAQAMGAKYAALTAIHRAGFCLWPASNSLTPYNVTQTSWYMANGNPDIVQQFVTLFTAAAIKPVIYFNVLTEYYRTITNPTFTQPQLLAFIQSLMTQLLSTYGPNIAIWIDGTFGSPSPWATYTDLYSFVNSIQPNCLIINNSHLMSASASQIIEYEQPQGESLPVPNTLGPSEANNSVQSNNAYFWESGQTPKSLVSQQTALATCNNNNANFLLNMPPDTTGSIPSAYVTAMTGLL